jgi:hypothetical protein
VNFFIVEEEYINKDYLTNFSHYYSTCFSDFKKKSSRIHFFRCAGTVSQQLRDTIECYLHAKDNSTNIFDEYYAGYIVINPIPRTFLGCTLLKHYNCYKDLKEEGRKFWGTKNYVIHFGGSEASVNSLAFHEQDGNVGACATAAIWSVLQKAAEDYTVNLKSQIEITKDAGVSQDGKRMLPNIGLTLESICIALTKNNLETEIFENTNGKKYLCRVISAYSHIGIPVILVMQVPNEQGCFDGHAVAVCGHFQEKSSPIKSDNPHHIVCRADFISKIYYHDDQCGPYVRGVFPSDIEEETVNVDIYKKIDESNNDNFDFSKIKEKFIDSTWTAIEIADNEYAYTDLLPTEELTGLKKKKLYATIHYVIVPVFPKVRINYKSIEENVRNIQSFLEKCEYFEDKNSWAYCSWDISLKYSYQFKNEIRNCQPPESVRGFPPNFKFTVLSQSLPKYIWVATMYCKYENNDYEYMTFIFDATGLVNTSLLLHVLFYLPNTKDKFVSVLDKIKVPSKISFERIYKELIDGKGRDNFFI